ncbi:hypothetical protein MOO46_07775 (plasmid) [Apilactobacillus apisilvae]|uniref:Glycosyl hydrolase family 25 n=1 Tax=Apilactobacillus apisilvae TaxID=2923364 RepID=A0ABY4PK91_9LACO|nr:GH25 family lysozyme [Apilactobacillus apisilvae]UQS85830.1 hypothetical protein MOO46_07775 [Apilactobacillus apisilvae]
MKIRADLAVYQGSTEGYIKELKRNHGVTFTSVQLSYGDNPYFDNRNSVGQIYNSWKVLGQVGAYHFYLGDPVPEAKHFLARVNQHKLDKDTELMLDVEGNLSGNVVAQINTFLDILYNAGFHNLAVYYSETFGLNNNYKLLHHHPKIWVASYSHKPNCYFDVWQYTQSAQTSSGGLDLSYDYSKDTTLAPDTYVKTTKKGKLFKVIADGGLAVSRDVALKHHRTVYFGKNSQVYGSVVPYGKATRVKTKLGYISGNTKWVKLI